MKTFGTIFLIYIFINLFGESTKIKNDNNEICQTDTFNRSTVSTVCFKDSTIKDITIVPFKEPSSFDKPFAKSDGIRFILFEGKIKTMFIYKNNQITEYKFSNKGKIKEIKEW